ncbi:c-5 sterol desaturase [Blastomyces dermatitidis]|uniref:C-5 sterol desaturase n=2 Tax=Ajellomyces dermatitidis TaxID=5039 RepID=F2TV63_AJEDA|nr:C-5 sterol desaturase [Blastomyces dermatitidis ER-3]XP_045282831.1 C-5 sterol desaturase, variant [Blastomyces dermatitidis ER-3]EGE87126.1 C-5 sterol desaturase [Blastomyces dermatitidis ATCC 18188]EQL32279.1 C-5 sterol desaturase [Blastomyces dermatitidis ATCC 26199]EEQ85884.1 C-5 sterol desaturase [Blastomyces dermatitidis ER-3]EQL32280.1 C-5 sterol desaturase, variant [Blastomyces dermatitidis ATCC 26199]OAT03104.1 C-5 sterol desaturase, variant [Blastomyces dermatitidis ER-3]
MDVILEVLDTFIFDYFYAKFAPAKDAAAIVSSFSGSLNATKYEFVGAGGYVYQPTSSYFKLQPSIYAYTSSLPRDNLWRQLLTLYLITWIFGLLVYFIFATLSYVFIFDKSTFNHPKYLKNQIRMEIKQASISLPIMAILTAPIFLLEVRGYAKMYDSFEDAPFALYNYLQIPFFLLFTDFLIYWIHRGLHHPLVYKHLHKPHHKWIMPTPYASHAFHPIDGYAQGIPYHLYPFLFPLQKFAYVFFFIFINIWTVLIHDGEYVANSPIINGAACHTMHHLYFNFNYGQFTTIWDRLGGSYRKPNIELFHKETKMAKEEWERQVKEMESRVQAVEGGDDRTYVTDVDVKESKKTR